MNIFRITAKFTDGQKTFWGEKQGEGLYLKLNRNGNPNNHYFVLAPGDLISEKPAKMNNKYGLLEVEQ